MVGSRFHLLRLRRFVVGAAIALAVAACTTVPRLDDAKVVEVGLASTSDLTRYAEARAVRSRELFGGVSFSDGTGKVVSFSADQYDEYQTYLRDHPDAGSALRAPARPRWPVMRLVFRTDRALFDPKASVPPHTIFYLCASGPEVGRLFGFGFGEVMWHGRIVTPERAREIERSQEGGARSQAYELFFDYVYWEVEHTRSEGQPVTLLPLPDDLCVAMFHHLNYPLPASIGRPIRIAKERVNAAVGPVPRLLPVQGETSNRADAV